jgi:transcriptional regulator with XRE-family HTH domain
VEESSFLSKQAHSEGLLMDASSLAERIRSVRRRRGLTQGELAAAAGMSLSLVKKLEQGTITDLRLETLHKFAVALKVPTSHLAAGPEQPDPVPADQWDDIRDALYRSAPDDIAGQATTDGVLGSLAALMPAWRASEYSRVHDLLPALIRDALSLGDDGRAARSRVLNATAWLLTMTRQFDDAMTAGRLALDAAPDVQDSMAAVGVMAWCLLRQGRLGDAGDLAVGWADRAEPRFSRATDAELAAYGKVLLYVNNALIRDNRPGDAEDAMSLARAAAAKIRRDVPANASTTMTFGPAQVQIIAAENASLAGQPERVLTLAERISGAALAQVEPVQRLRHRLDVVGAHVAMRQYAEGMAVLREIHQAAPQWLIHQRYARDILSQVVQRRRTLTAEMRELADAVRLPL